MYNEFQINLILNTVRLTISQIFLIILLLIIFFNPTNSLTVKKLKSSIHEFFKN